MHNQTESRLKTARRIVESTSGKLYRSCLLISVYVPEDKNFALGTYMLWRRLDPRAYMMKYSPVSYCRTVSKLIVNNPVKADAVSAFSFSS